MADNDQVLHRSRGKGFPTMPLDEAVAVIKEAGQYGREHSLGAFAGYLGHGTTNSGPFRAKMAALKDWGLVQRRGEEVVLSDLGTLIAHPETSEAEQKTLQDAFRHAELFDAIYQESAKGIDLNLDLIGNRAVTVFGVAPRSKKRFAESFAKSAATAGLAQMSSDSTVELLAKAQGNAQQTSPRPADEFHTAASGAAAAASATGPGLKSFAAAAPTLHQEWTVAGGTLIFQAVLDGALPAAAYGHIAKIADAVEQLVEFLGPVDEPDARHPSPIESADVPE